VGISKTKSKIGKLHILVFEWDTSTDIKVVKLLLGSSPDAELVTVIDSEIFKTAIEAMKEASMPIYKQRDVTEYMGKDIFGNDKPMKRYEYIDYVSNAAFCNIFDPYAKTLAYAERQKPWR
jgi:hypothetical protein